MTTTMAVAAPQGAETSDHFRKTALFFSAIFWEKKEGQ